MYRNLLILPDGTELFSGVTGQAAIQSATITQCVNSGQELTPGSVCAGMLEVTVLTPAAFSLEAGQEVTLYKVLSTGQRIKQGLYTLEKPVRQSAGIYKLTAYDRVSWLDKDLTGWLAGLTGWPYALYDLAQLVCEECGVTLAGDQIPNGSYLVQRFSAEGITGRQIMQWIGQAACRFCRATEDGALEFAWYAPVRQHRICPSDAQNITVTYDDAGDVAMTSGGLTVRYDQGSLTLDSPSLAAVCNREDLALSTQTVLPYYQNGLQFSDYTTAPIEKVQIRLTGEDVGAVWPDNAASANTYILVL